MITGKQISAIRNAIRLGKILQRNHPEIKDLYGPHTHSEIVRILKIDTLYCVPNSVAITAIWHAIRGHKGGFRVVSYSGLLSLVEAENISREHWVKQGIERSAEQFIKGTGLRGRTFEENSKAGKKGYKKGLEGKSNDELREYGRRGYISGLSKMTFEQRSKARCKGAKARGETLWSIKEIETLYQLSQEAEYQYSKGANTGKPNKKLIASELNNMYHDGKNIRWQESVSSRLKRYRASLKTKAS